MINKSLALLAAAIASASAYAENKSLPEYVPVPTNSTDYSGLPEGNIWVASVVPAVFSAAVLTCCIVGLYSACKQVATRPRPSPNPEQASIDNSQQNQLQ